jgi:hypothetical protein
MAKVPTPPQFVLLAFDGSNEVEFWKTTRQFAASAEVRFTYFISGVFFLLDADKNFLRGPRGPQRQEQYRVWRSLPGRDEATA